MDFSHPSKMLANCPMCQALYEEKEIRLLGERGVTRLFHCTCHACGHAMLAVILETQGAISSVGLVTDLEAQDAIRFKDLQPLQSEDCLKIHRLLKRHSVEFCRALSQETKPKV
jgi:Zn ribbon nucleic-acid-binding protein